MTVGVYLAYPIDQAGGDQRMETLYELIAYAKVELQPHVSWQFDPGDAFAVNLNMALTDSVANINRHAHLQADAVLAFLPASVASIGVPMEIDRAVRFGKNVAIITDVRSMMLQYPGLGRNVQLFDLEEMERAVDAAVHWLSYVQPRDEDAWRTRDPLAVRVGPEGRLPSRVYGDDAGLDLYVSKDSYVQRGETIDVPCDIAVEFPARTWGMIFGRSSTVRKRGLVVNPGIIDNGWRGDLFVSVTNINDKMVGGIPIGKGERIAQLIMFYNTTASHEPVQVAELNPSERGTNGFGSSGS